MRLVDHDSSFAVIGGSLYLIHMLGLLCGVGNDEGLLRFGRVEVQRPEQNGDLVAVQTQLNPLKGKHTDRKSALSRGRERYNSVCED